MIVIIGMALNHQKMLYYWHLEQTPPVGKQKIGLVGWLQSSRFQSLYMINKSNPYTI